MSVITTISKMYVSSMANIPRKRSKYSLFLPPTHLPIHCADQNHHKNEQINGEFEEIMSTYRAVVIQIYNADAAHVAVRGIVRPIYLTHFAANHHVWGIVARHIHRHTVDLDNMNVVQYHRCCGWCCHLNITGNILTLNRRLVVVRQDRAGTATSGSMGRALCFACTALACRSKDYSGVRQGCACKKTVKGTIEI